MPNKSRNIDRAEPPHPRKYPAVSTFKPKPKPKRKKS